MARKKTITREQILAAAYEVAATDGFTRFTARNIANKMNCSTQPIYLEFKNMDDLRQALFEQIYDHLQYEVFTVLRRIWWRKRDAEFLLYLLCEYSETRSSLCESFRRADRIFV